MAFLFNIRKVIGLLLRDLGATQCAGVIPWTCFWWLQTGIGAVSTAGVTLRRVKSVEVSNVL